MRLTPVPYVHFTVLHIYFVMRVITKHYDGYKYILEATYTTSMYISPTLRLYYDIQFSNIYFQKQQ